MIGKIEEKIIQIEAMADLTGGVLGDTNLQADKTLLWNWH